MSLNRYLGQVWVKHELVVLSKFLMLQYIHVHVATSKCCYSKMLIMISLLIADLDLSVADLDLSIAYLDLSTALKELGLSL